MENLIHLLWAWAWAHTNSQLCPVLGADGSLYVIVQSSSNLLGSFELLLLPNFGLMLLCGFIDFLFVQVWINNLFCSCTKMLPSDGYNLMEEEQSKAVKEVSTRCGSADCWVISQTRVRGSWRHQAFISSLLKVNKRLNIKVNLQVLLHKWWWSMMFLCNKSANCTAHSAHNIYFLKVWCIFVYWNDITNLYSVSSLGGASALKLIMKNIWCWVKHQLERATSKQILHYIWH